MEILRPVGLLVEPDAAKPESWPVSMTLESWSFSKS